MITIFYWILGVSSSEFPVDIENNRSVGHLMGAITKENPNTFLGVDAHQLMLWKVSIPITRQLKNKVNEHQFHEEESLLAGDLLEEIFPPPQPSKKTLHIVVRPPTSITASRSSNSNIAAYIALKRPHPYSPDDLDSAKRMRLDDDAWLLAIHAKIWGQQDIRQELFHTVEITAAHYNELQERLNQLYPDRHARGYFARAASAGVLSTKLEVLRNFKPSLVAPAPELVPADNGQANNGEEEEIDNNNDPRSLFPVTIRYLDLSRLELDKKMVLRMPLAFLIRDEYTILSDLLNTVDSAIISGQPGIGKTAYLYLRMVLSIIEGSPFLYQTLRGTVYHVADTITTITSLPSGSEIVAYIDADEKKFEPQSFLRHPSVKIIAASSPQGTEQPWMKQMGNVGFPMTFASALWTESELFVTGIFLHPQDLTYARLKEATTYFGFNPRLCFIASGSAVQLRQLQSRVESTVESTALKRDIGHLIVLFKNSIMLSHTIFELSPVDGNRLFGEAQVGIVSPWALNLLLDAYEAQKSDAAFEFYNSITSISKAGTLRGRILERQVLRYFDNIKEPHTFILRSLKNGSTIEWVYPGPTKHYMFQPTSFAKELQGAVQNKESLHLVPKDPNFPALDSIVYDPKHGGLTLNHSFTRQRLEGDTITQEWGKKVDQYVLGIEEKSLWGRTR